MENQKRDQLLDEAIKQIEKQYGKGSIMQIGRASCRERV